MTEEDKIQKQMLIVALKLAISKGESHLIAAAARSLREFLTFEKNKYHSK